MRRGLGAALGVMGCVATVAGGYGVARGAAGVTGREGPLDASVDSELRFFSAWYAAAGLGMLHAARAPERAGAAVRLLSAGWLLAAVGRLLSVRSVGRPHNLYLGLTGVELAIPVVVLPWQRAVERAAAAGGSEVAA